MSYDDDYDDDEFYEEEWEYFEEEEEEKLRDRVSILDILKLILLFVSFVGFFLYFRYWDVFAGWLTFGSENPQIGQSRMIYFTLLVFPVAASFFLVGLVKVSRTLFIPPKEAAIEE